MNQLKAGAMALAPALKELKDTLHRQPEASFQEFYTTALICGELNRLGLPLVDLDMSTGVVAVLEGALPGATVALRADMDAIAEHESVRHEVRSGTEVLMHGCGHDFHTACLWGAAKLLSGMRDQIPGRVVFLFQPAEEVTQGAAAMLAHGLLERLPDMPACLFGLHNRPELPCGQIAVMEGAVMAGKTNFRITLRGKAGHGGSPHKCVDPVVAGAALTSGIQTIVSRNTDPLDALVCAVYSLHTDAPDFFVPTSLTMTGSIRFHREPVGQSAARRLKELTGHTAAAYGCESELELLPQVPVTRNPPALAEIARCAAAETVGPENVVTPPPDMGSEDFAVFGARIPAFFYWLGSGYPDRVNAPWHSPGFETDDDALPLGSELLARSALTALDWQNSQRRTK